MFLKISKTWFLIKIDLGTWLSECSVNTVVPYQSVLSVQLQLLRGIAPNPLLWGSTTPLTSTIYIYLRFSVIYSFCWYNTLDCVANKFNTTLCKFCCLTYCTCYQSEPSYSTTTLGVTLPPKMIANTIELTIEEKNSLFSTLPHFVARVCFGTISWLCTYIKCFICPNYRWTQKLKSHDNSVYNMFVYWMK